MPGEIPIRRRLSMTRDLETPLPLGILPGWRSAAVIAAWFLLIAAANSQLFFRPAPGAPPIALLLAVAVPPLLFVLAYLASSGFRGFVLALDLRLLTATQCWRVGGASFIVLEAQDLLPPLFAYPAGYGDVFVGIFALVALIGLERAAPGCRQRLVWLNVLGLFDFAVALGTALLASDGPLGLLRGPVSTMPLQQFPLYIVPTFAVPFWIVIHLASLLQLRRLTAGETSARWHHATA
jgi:hypothetical protein